MTAPVTDVNVYGDFAGLDALRQSARNHDPSAVREVAKQFEALFARMMIKSMRDAIGRDPIFGSDQAEAYQSMFDDQLSIELTRGHGLGLADMLVRQLQRMGVTGASSPSSGQGSTTSKTGAATQSLAPPKQVERNRFIGALWPQAQQAGAALGVSPVGIVAQAALETDWGRGIPRDASGQSSHNLFGVKAGGSWSGPAVTATTWEQQNGAAVSTTAAFRMYQSPTQGLGDYVALLKGNPRYAAALNTGGNVQAFAAALQRAGYATDPSYARKLSSIASDISASLTQNAAGASPLVASSGEALKFASALPTSGGASALL